MEKTAKILGVDQDAISEKCAKYSMQYMHTTILKLDDVKSREYMLNYIRENFSSDELLYFAKAWLDEKTLVAIRCAAEKRMPTTDDLNL